MNRRLSALLLCLGCVTAATLAFAAPAAPASAAEPAGTSAASPALAQAAPSAAAGQTSAAATPASAGTVREIELPVETGTYRQGPGVELAQAFCVTCHSVEYCETQPLSGEKYWAATVKKMKEKFGAPLPDEVIAPLTRYLTTTYGKPSP